MFQNSKSSVSVVNPLPAADVEAVGEELSVLDSGFLSSFCQLVFHRDRTVLFPVYPPNLDASDILCRMPGF